MPRVSKRPALFLALSPAGAANALCIQPQKVRDAIQKKLLPVHVNGANHRILVADVEKWVRSWPQPTKRIYRKRKVVPHA